MSLARRIRAAAVVGLLWSATWAAAAVALTSLRVFVWRPHVAFPRDYWIRLSLEGAAALGVCGFGAGVLFAFGLRRASRATSLGALPVRRSVAWGALAGALVSAALPILGVRHLTPILIAALITSVVGAASARLVITPVRPVGTRRLGSVVGGVLTVAGAVLGWQHYYPKSAMIAALGMPGPRADAGRRCGGWYRQLSWGGTLTREVTCGPRLAPWPSYWVQQEVSLDRLTRRVTHVGRTAALPDFAAWTATRDSVERALAALGGLPMLCEPVHPALTHIRSVDAWRFPTYSVRLIAYHWAEKQRSGNEPAWLLQLDGYPDDPPDCAVVIP
jgi:hypothetical protein